MTERVIRIDPERAGRCVEDADIGWTGRDDFRNKRLRRAESVHPKRSSRKGQFRREAIDSATVISGAPPASIPRRPLLPEAP
jgi:hypothetical protein